MVSNNASTSQEESPETTVYRGQQFLNYLYEQSQTPTGRAAVVGVKVSAENVKLLGLSALNPKGQAIVLSAVMLRKAMHFAGIGTSNQAIQCVIAVSKLGSTFVLAGALAPTGPPALIPLAVAALESYQVGRACFVNNEGSVSHAVEISGPN